MCTRVSNFSILFDERFGFIRSISTKRTVYSFTDRNFSTVDNKRYVCGKSSDLAKEFAGVECDITIKTKLKEFKVWLDSCLNYR
jgi:hypothetical protein